MSRPCGSGGAGCSRLAALVVATFLATGCGSGGSDDSPDVAITTQQTEGAAPTCLFDLRAAVDLVRPVPGRIRDAATRVCAA